MSSIAWTEGYSDFRFTCAEREDRPDSGAGCNSSPAIVDICLAGVLAHGGKITVGRSPMMPRATTLN